MASSEIINKEANIRKFSFSRLVMKLTSRTLSSFTDSNILANIYRNYGNIHMKRPDGNFDYFDKVEYNDVHRCDHKNIESTYEIGNTARYLLFGNK